MAIDLKIMEVAPGRPISYHTWPAADYAAGEYALVQKITRGLLTERGSDAFDPDWGTDLKADLDGLSSTDQGAAQAAAADAVRHLEALLKTSTANDPDPSSRLLALSVNAVAFNDATSGWDIDLAVTTAAGTLRVTV